ncbi:SDR family NAD(P)-dependent oxidoreductase [Pseudorhodobacter aquimaris]|uniref:SDR family NAD(P)-dependent oxidoreductase n=1 Tax=Pseudorhodobacter aquimaris TaxID=687412 RepID=UPI00067C125D|nr:SDR family NAD(P)-dependent oxidoreductase [Pseudorhodobacter aquimaris]
MKTVFVTGVSQGLGLAIAKRLAADGYRVVGLSRRLSAEYKTLMDHLPEAVSFEEFDVSDIAGMPDHVRKLLKTYAPVYGLVNNAGIGLDGVLATQHQSDIDKILKTNLTGPITLTKYVSRSMMARGEGRIVNISSIIASTGFHGLAVYAASKAGLEGFTRSLSRELGKMKLTVNCVAPGYMETEMTDGLAGEKLNSVRRRAPLGLPRVEDAAGAVAYLLGPDGAATTGTVITVDGGSTA